ILVGIQDVENERPVPQPSETPGESGGDSGGPRMALPEGASGNPTVTDHGHIRIPDTGLPPAMSRADAIRNAREGSWLGRQLLASAIRDLAERPDVASGFDTVSADGALIGDFGEGGGNFGAGRAGSGLGGGCSDGPCGYGLIAGDLRYGTISDGPGAGGRYGLPRRGPGIPDPHPALPTSGPPRGHGSGPHQ